MFKSKKTVPTAATTEFDVKGQSQGQLIRKKFFRHKGAVFGLVYFVLLVLFVFSSAGLHLKTPIGNANIPGWWPIPVDQMDEVKIDLSPDGILTIGAPTLDLNPFDGNGMSIGIHPAGQDNIGHDYFSLVINGAQTSLMVMFIIGIVSGLLGTIIGSISGYFGGKVDQVLMRFTDLIITIPTVIIGALIGAKFGNLGVVILALFLGMFAWTGLARLVRGEFLSLREREFVDAARVSGAKNGRIIFKHILPNAVGVIIVSVSLILSGAILLETSLSYVGFGVQAPEVSLGTLISIYQDSFQASPWLFWWPGFFMVTIALSVNFIGDGLRDAFDPRQGNVKKFRSLKNKKSEKKTEQTA